MELKMRIRRFEEKLREVEEREFESREAAVRAAQALRKMRREIWRKGGETTAEEIRVEREGAGWRVRRPKATKSDCFWSGGGNTGGFALPEATKSDQKRPEATISIEEVLERLEE